MLLQLLLFYVLTPLFQEDIYAYNFANIWYICMILKMVKGINYLYKQTYWKVIILVCVVLLFGKGLDMDEFFCIFIIVELKCGLVVIYLVIVALCLDSII